MMLVLAFNCQKDETVDINAGGQPSTEVSPIQLQDRAREIVNSEEYRNFTSQTDVFLSKIHSEDFLTEELIDEENEAYRYDVINERLSGTSFESAEEFVREYEKMVHLGAELGKKYPDLANQPMQNAMINVDIEEEPISENNPNVRGNWISPCVKKCKREKTYCEEAAYTTYAIAMISCICSANCPCVLAATAAYFVAKRYCKQSYDSCVNGCLGF